MKSWEAKESDKPIKSQQNMGNACLQLPESEWKGENSHRRVYKHIFPNCWQVQSHALNWAGVLRANNIQTKKLISKPELLIWKIFSLP